jgi:quinol-cytochrome oxidoreductase complex cytochrome b subunit
MKSKLFSWFDDRFNLTPLIDFMKHKQVPVHKHSIWYYMGGVTLFLFIVQVFSGILLLMYYQPGADSAYESVRFIMTTVNFGWLVRQVHSWAANLMILFIFIHMFSVFFTRAYKKPRELTWMTGMVLMFISMFAGFSGYLLPWNELAFFATKVGTDIGGAVPIIGDAIKVMLRGGEDVTGATLSRFYAFHVALIPALLSIVVSLHLLFVQRQGMHEPSYIAKLPADKKKVIPFFPNFVLRDALLWLIVLNILLYLAVFFPWEMGLKADPFASAPIGIKPEWYFMFMFQTLKYLPAHIWIFEGEVLGILGFGLIALAWVLVPFWHIKAKTSSKFKPMTVIGLIGVSYIIILSVVGYLE